MIEDHSQSRNNPSRTDAARTTDPPRHTLTHPWPATFRYAWEGLRYTWRTQRNFRAESLIGTLALVLCALLGVNPASILICCALVLSLEMVNTAFEAVVDLAAPTYHPLAKIAKDVAAGAVLIAALVSVLVGLVVLGPPLLRFLGLG
jgi:diacylglycerol kinase (ATP)